MDDIKENICRFCLKTVYIDSFKALEDVTKQMLNELLVKLNLTVSEEPGVCTECSTIIEKFFDFKLTYIYLKQNENLQLQNDATDDQKICQLCTAKSEEATCKILNSTMVNMLQKHIPEMNLSGIEKLVICEVCEDSLQNFLKFITECSIVEAKIQQYMKAQGTDDEGQIKLINIQQFTLIPKLDHVEECDTKDVFDIKQGCSKSGDITMKIKSEDATMRIKSEDTTVKIKSEVTTMKIKSEDITTQIKSENECLTGPHDQELESSEDDADTPEQSFLQVSSSLTQLKVSIAEQEEFIKKHMMIHKNPSEVTMYQCDICWYWAKCGDTLRHHVLKHLHSTKTKCAPCLIRSPNSDRRVKVKKRPRTTMYRCNFCTYETGSNNDYRVHMAEHETSSKVIIYECKSCSFQTKYKDYFKKHTAGHKNRTKTVLYPCDLCLFQTRYKSYFTEHMKEHENSATNPPSTAGCFKQQTNCN